MTYRVDLDIYRGASLVAEGRVDYDIEAKDAFAALCDAERNLNVQLPEDRYCVAKKASPLPVRFNPPALLAA